MAYMTFVSAGNTITALDAKSQQITSLNVQGGGKSFRLHRNGNTVATTSHNSITGTTKMTIHGQEVKMRQSWEGMRSGKDISTPVGKFAWRVGGSSFHSTEELIEKSTGATVASCRIPTLGKGDRKLKILIQRDDFVVDLAVASWIILLDK